jgi:hypothetical protein
MSKESNGRDPVERQYICPGPGWRHLAGAVYEHNNGTRMHMLGLVRLPSGEFLNASKWPDCHDAARMIRINGGNRRRGLMAWAMAYNTESRSSGGNT